MKKPFLSPAASNFHANLRSARQKLTLRGGELALILLATVIGLGAGLVVTAMNWSTHMLQGLVFRTHEDLAIADIASLAILLGPAAGGFVLAAITWLPLRWKRRASPVDPIEANALHGGRMSIRESLLICAQNIVSNGFGASVGMEAAYTQISSALASRLGRLTKLARGDMRLLVGCGSAGAISAAFDAPLTGAFYGIEVIIGTYSSRTLAPVIVSSIVANIVNDLLVGPGWVLSATGIFWPLHIEDFIPAIILAFICAAFGILLMQAVAFVDSSLRKSAIPAWFRPTVGGIVVGGLALVSPQVLGAGHGAMQMNLTSQLPVSEILMLLGLKAAASAISIGSGFRGGLFFASLFLGVLTGQIFAEALTHVMPAAQSSTVFAIIGMSALGAAVVGGPLAMTFLALEMTADFAVTVLVLAAVMTSTVIVRTLFGYSFATWRFHLRGETIRSAHDVGWIRDMTVARLMRKDMHIVPSDMLVKAFLREFPLGSTQRVIVTDGGRYVGLVFPAEVQSESLLRPTADASLKPFLRFTDDVLLPSMNVQQAALEFERARSEALVVVDDASSNRPIGLLTEAYTLRRYSETLDQQRRDIGGLD